jgi:tungstate transport system ATP-binding protein
MSFISVRDVYRKVKGRAILKGVSLELEQGDVLGIIGPSGAGKTSLLRIINMLDRPDDGHVYLDGKDMWASDRLEVQRSMAMVFQKPMPFSRSVYENVAYGMKLRGLRRTEIDAAVEDVLKLLDMQGKEWQYARSLSGGEAQRLAFARAYVLKPKLLLLDEPTANLDPANASIMERAIRDINKRYGTTVILVTHNMYQARRLANQTAFMMDGELIELKPTSELFDRPVDHRTREFVKGDMAC